MVLEWENTCAYLLLSHIAVLTFHLILSTTLRINRDSTKFNQRAPSVTQVLLQPNCTHLAQSLEYSAHTLYPTHPRDLRKSTRERAVDTKNILLTQNIFMRLHNPAYPENFLLQVAIVGISIWRFVGPASLVTRRVRICFPAPSF